MDSPDSSGATPSVRIKICGLTSVDDARLALEAGADALGVNMVAGPRQVDPQTACAILEATTAWRDSHPSVPGPAAVLLARVSEGGLSDEVEQVVRHTSVRWLQLYGEVTGPAVGAQLDLGRRPVPVVRVADEGFAASFNALLGDCGDRRPAAVVLDAYHREKLGGTGEPFCWSWVVQARQRGELDGWPPIVLAGGLNPDNVADAVRTVRPWAVDVSSGVEAEPGRKDPARLADFIRNVRRVSQ